MPYKIPIIPAHAIQSPDLRFDSLLYPFTLEVQTPHTYAYRRQCAYLCAPRMFLATKLSAFRVFDSHVFQALVCNIA